jgi:hypothetical protein
VDTPLEQCRRRDVKGLYRQALAGQVPAFTGVSDPYEPPLAAEITVSTIDQSPDQSASAIISWLERRGYLDVEMPAPAPAPAPVTTAASATLVTAAPDGRVAQDGPAYSPDEEEAVSARLEALGYL